MKDQIFGLASIDLRVYPVLLVTHAGHNFFGDNTDPIVYSKIAPKSAAGNG